MTEKMIGDDRRAGLIRWISFFTLGLYWAIWCRKILRELIIHTDDKDHLNFPNPFLPFISWLLAFFGIIVFGMFNYVNLGSIAPVGILMILVGYLLFVYIRFTILSNLRQHYIDISADYLKEYMNKQGMSGMGFVIADPDTDLTEIKPGMNVIYPIGDSIIADAYIPPRQQIRDEFGSTGSRIYKSFIPYQFSIPVQDSLNRHWDFVHRHENYYGETEYI